MIRPSHISLLCGSLVLVWTLALSSHAQNVKASAQDGYGRIFFNFSAPAKLKTNVAGNRAVLDFDKPVVQSPDSIKAGLPRYVTDVTVSDDKKRVTLGLSKPYRIRQFVSGNSVGVDLVGTPGPAPKKNEDILTTKRDEAPAKAEYSTRKQPAPAPVNATPVAKKPAEKPTKKAVVSEPKPAADPMLTTKREQSAPKPQAPAPKAAEPKRAPEKPTLSAAAEQPAVEPKAEPTIVKPAPAPEPEEPAATPGKSRPFVVSTRTGSDGETVINFPWDARTGAAVFRRGRDIWAVFSRQKDVNAPALRTVMPKQVANVTQYHYDGNTVLRMTTDGSISARAKQSKGGYGWNVVIGRGAADPELGTDVNVDSLDGTQRLVLGAYDLAPSVRFYDPSVGDELIIVPAYENGRGIAQERNFPEMSLLAAPQGIAIVAKRPDVTASQTRAGFVISAPNGLAISDSLPKVEGTMPVPRSSANSAGGLIPYDQWYVPPEKLRDTELERLKAVAASPKAAKPDALFELVKLYLQQGYGAEAGGLLARIKADYPDYYATNKLALLSAASHVLQNHIDEAADDLKAPELLEVEEAMPWREVVAVYSPAASTAQLLQDAAGTATTDSVNNTAPSAGETKSDTAPVTVAANKPVFHFLKYNKSFIHSYPPRIRQQLAQLAGDAYLADGEEEKALASYDTLMKDSLLDPVQTDAQYALGRVAEKKGEVDRALEIYDRMAKQSADPRTQARARFSGAALRYTKGKLPPAEAATAIEGTRLTWRGDAVEREMLDKLYTIYSGEKKYDDMLRTQRAMLDGFPNDPQALAVSGDMGALFEKIFLDGLADEMDPLKALSLFYEFRELTPLGDKGDKIIQKLADRLAAIDLLDRATQLLEHQVKFRSTGVARSQIGARLALLHLLNQHPQEALDVLEVTNYGGNSPELQVQRQQLTAEALTKLNKNEEALGVLSGDKTKEGAQLRMDILWSMQDWPNVINRAEDMLAARANLTDALSPQETETLLKLALGYAFEGDNVQLRYLRDYYSGLIPDTNYKQIFDYITNDTTPLDPEDFALVAQQINRTQGFLDTFKEKIAAGKLSEAVSK